MVMKRSMWIAASVVVVTGSACSTTQSVPERDAGSIAEAVPTAFVSPQEVRIEIPVSSVTDWTWYAATTPENALEYAWQVQVGAEGAKRHSFGVSLFKHPGAEPAQGSLAELIEAGQANVWELHESGGARMEGRIVYAEPAGDRISIVLRDLAMIEALFGSRPESVTLKTVAPGAQPREEEINVRYVSS